MMRVYICPACGWVRVVSRRKNVECFKCGGTQMTVAKLPYEKFASMTEEDRNNYVDSWLYIHGGKDKTDRQ